MQTKYRTVQFGQLPPVSRLNIGECPYILRIDNRVWYNSVFQQLLTQRLKGNRQSHLHQKGKIVCSRLKQNQCRYYRSCKAPISVHSSLIVVQVKNLQLRLTRCHILCSGGSYTSDQYFAYNFYLDTKFQGSAGCLSD